MTADLSVTLTYQQRGTRPPLYVAGTFSEPAWEPQEMECSTPDAGGEMTFSKTCVLAPGEDVQYKFRVGTGDWWVLDESRPTVRDPMGNVNNVLRAPVEEQREAEPKNDTNGGPPEDQRKPEPKADANGGPPEDQREPELKDDANGGPPEISVLPILEDEDGGIECDSTTNLLSGLGKSNPDYGTTQHLTHVVPTPDAEETSGRPEPARPNGPTNASPMDNATPAKKSKRGLVSRILLRVWAGLGALFRRLFGKTAA